MLLFIYATVCIKKRLFFVIQISHMVLNYLRSIIACRKTKDFLHMGHDRLISFVNKTRFFHVSLTLRTSEQ